MNIDRAATPKDIELGALSLYRRLGRALDALDEGDLSGADDLAGLLRTLLADGNGNRVVSRLASARGVQPGGVYVSGPPGEPPGLVIAAGLLPMGRHVEHANGHERTFAQWLGATSFRVAGDRRPDHSWKSVVNLSGNTTGSHLSTTVPKILDESKFAGVAGFTLHHYLLRQIAWQTEAILGAMLSELGHPVRPADRRIEAFGVLVGNLAISRVGDNIRSSSEFSVTEGPADLFTFELDGQVHRFFLSADMRLQHEILEGSDADDRS